MRIGILLLLALPIFSGCRHLSPRVSPDACLRTVPEETRQAVVVSPKQEPGREVVVRLFERGERGWEAAASMDGVAGRNGIAPPGEKREGDGMTPSGTYPLERGFGYEPLETKLPYIVLTPEMIWVDDPASPLYNTLTSKSEGGSVSHEIMRRSDDLYKHGIVVEYNTKKVVPGAGSAIFFHIWRDPATPTSGCVATSEADLVRILQWLDPRKKPVTVIGDRCGG